MSEYDPGTEYMLEQADDAGFWHPRSAGAWWIDGMLYAIEGLLATDLPNPSKPTREWLADRDPGQLLGERAVVFVVLVDGSPVQAKSQDDPEHSGWLVFDSAIAAVDFIRGTTGTEVSDGGRPILLLAEIESQG